MCEKMREFHEACVEHWSVRGSPHAYWKRSTEIFVRCLKSAVLSTYLLSKWEAKNLKGLCTPYWLSSWSKIYSTSALLAKPSNSASKSVWGVCGADWPSWNKASINLSGTPFFAFFSHIYIIIISTIFSVPAQWSQWSKHTWFWSSRVRTPPGARLDKL